MKILLRDSGNRHKNPSLSIIICVESRFKWRILEAGKDF